MESIQVTPKEMKLLLEGFGIKIEEKQCHYCGCFLEIEHTCLMHAFKSDENKSYILICDSPLCISEYLEDEKEENDGMNG